MRRRLDLAMSLVSDPPVLVLDEPTTGLDPRSRRAVWDAVAGLRADGVTVLLTTQYLEEADRLADRVVVLDAGRVVAEGTAERLKAAVGSETVELVLTDPLALERARAAVGGRHAEADVERVSLRVRTDGSPAAVRDLLDLMDAAGVTVLRLALHRPTLDDVFLTLTGRP
jgi:ABC-2 type transport system ATP-binding protein